jgi:pSer/pThr/pTyr-binding forkhead associated (FHA) protein
MPIFEIYDSRNPRRIKVELPRITIGRMADNPLYIDERQASRKHCEIYLEEGRYFLRDLCSRNGTLLNQDKVEKAEPLFDGDEIGIGGSTIRFWSALDTIDPKAAKLPLYDLDKLKKAGEKREGKSNRQ